MKVDKSILIPAGIAIVAAGIYFITRKGNQEQEYSYIPTPVNTPTNTPATTTTITLDKNKLLKVGINGAETKELQKLLGITMDGIFGPQTESTLLVKRGVKQTTLNQFATLPTVNQNPIPIGSRVMVNIREGLIPKLATELADGSFAMSDTSYKTFDFGEEIGKIISMTPSKNYYVVKEENIFSSDVYMFVSAANVKQI